MKSKMFVEMKDTHTETFLGSFKTLRNNAWIMQTGCPLNNKQLKIVEKGCKKKGKIFQSIGTFGTKSLFYFDQKLGEFVGFGHTPKVNQTQVFQF